MRKLIVVNAISLDGHTAGPGGDLSPMPFDGGFSAYNVERLRAADTLLLGRLSYLGFLGHWPDVEHDDSQPEVERELSRLNNTVQKVVVSDSLTPASTGVWADSTRIVARSEAVDTVRTLKAEPGREIVTFGSFTAWNPLAEAGLVDELHVMVGPALLGEGSAVYAGGRVALALTGARQLPDSQLVLLTYTFA